MTYCTSFAILHHHPHLHGNHLLAPFSVPTAFSELFFEFDGYVATSTCYLTQRVCFLSHLSSGILPGPKVVLLFDHPHECAKQLIVEGEVNGLVHFLRSNRQHFPLSGSLPGHLLKMLESCSGDLLSWVQRLWSDSRLRWLSGNV